MGRGVYKNIFVLVCTAVFAACLSLDATAGGLGSRIGDLIKKKGFEDSQVGVCMAPVKGGKTVISKNGEDKFVPASLVKIVTTAAALDVLGPGYFFRTEVYIKGKKQGNVLDGNLYIKGFGDPSLVTERLLRLIYDIRRRGIRGVRGDVVLDDTAFDFSDPLVGRKGRRSFEASPAALSANRGAVNVYVFPAAKVGKRARVIIDTPSPLYELRADVVTVVRGKKINMDVYRNPKTGKVVVGIKGSIGLDAANGVRISRRVPDPVQNFAGQFLYLWQAVGGFVSGKVTKGKVGPGARRLFTFMGSPLREVLRDMNDFSNNSMADQVFLVTGMERFGPPANSNKGRAVVGEVLRRAGVFDGFDIFDGSGFDRNNRAKPCALVKLISWAASNPEFGPEFLASLTVPGSRGTLKRSVLSDVKGVFFRAKTGSLDGVSGLAGVMSSEQGEKFAFAIILNREDMDFSFGRKTTEEIASVLADYVSSK